MRILIAWFCAIAMGLLLTMAGGHASAASVASDKASVEALIQALEDPATRGRIIEALRSQAVRIDAEPGKSAPSANPAADEPADDGAASPTRLSPITMVLGQVRNAVTGLVRFAADAVDIDRLWGWTVIQAKSPESNAFWQNFLLAIGTVLGGAATAYWALRLGLRPMGLRLRHHVPKKHSGLRRYRLTATIAALELAPIAGLAMLGSC